jgi:hypothetical protein
MRVPYPMRVSVSDNAPVLVPATPMHDRRHAHNDGKPWRASLSALCPMHWWASREPSKLGRHSVDVIFATLKSHLETSSQPLRRLSFYQAQHRCNIFKKRDLRQEFAVGTTTPFLEHGISQWNRSYAGINRCSWFMYLKPGPRS